MTVTYGFFNSVAGDRTYNAAQMGALFDGIITDGVFSTVGSNLAVSPGGGLSVSVGSGRAWFKNTWTLNDSALVLAIGAPDMILPRIDAVVLEVNSGDAVRANSIKVIAGTPNSVPVAPTMVHTALINQYPLALVSVPVGVASILVGHITNKIGTTDCPYVTGPTMSQTQIHNAPTKDTPVDADEMGLLDSVASWGLKKFTWANLKSVLKTYNDTLYGNISDVPNENGGRLCLGAGGPISVSDITNAGTLYYNPYIGNRITLYSGGKWVWRSIGNGISKSLTGLSGGYNLDVFVYDNGGTPALDWIYWANATTRNTALAYQDGVLVKSGDPTRKFIGTIRTTGTGITEDSNQLRFVWNMYNKVNRKLAKVVGVNWTYQNYAWRPWNNDSANYVAFVSGDYETVQTKMMITAQLTSTFWPKIKFGLDSSNSPVSGQISASFAGTNVAGESEMISASYVETLFGYHFLYMLEYAHVAAAMTMVGAGSDAGCLGFVMG